MSIVGGMGTLMKQSSPGYLILSVWGVDLFIGPLDIIYEEIASILYSQLVSRQLFSLSKRIHSILYYQTTSKQAIKPLLDKHKASMPSKQSAPPSEEQSKGKGREKVEVKTEPKEEEVEEVTEKPPAKTSDKRGSGTKKGGTKSATRAKGT